MSKGDQLIKRRDAVVCPGVSRLSGLTAASAHGATITDLDGREFIDFAGGIGVMNIGHCDEGVVAAIREQAGRLLHTCIHVATYEGYVELCEELVRLFPHDTDPGKTKALLVNTGAEAVENSIKVARQATGRQAVICFTGAFHGRTLLCSSLTSKVGYKTNCGPFAPEIYRLPYPSPRPGERIGEDELSERELARLRDAFLNTVAASSVAAIIAEPVQGEGGFHVMPGAYARGLRQICDEHGIVLIFDEVQTGFGRTGRWAAFEHLGVKPDLSTWAKSLGGGMPIACVVGKASVMDKAAPGTIGGTYGGNPVACAAALATIRQMKKLDLNAHGERVGGAVRARFEAIASRVPSVTGVRGLGAMMAIELHDGGDVTRPGTETVKKIISTCREQGLLVIPAGFHSNVIRVLSPLVISDAELSRGLDILEQAIHQHAGAARVPAAQGA